MEEKNRSETQDGSRLNRYLGKLCIASSLFIFLYVTGILDRLGIRFYSIAALAFYNGVVLFLTFLTVPIGGGTRTGAVPWYDWLLAAISITGPIYIIVNSTLISEVPQWPSTGQQILAFLALITLLEAIRRHYGLVILGILVLFISYCFFGDLVPGAFHARSRKWIEFTSGMYLTPGMGIWGSALKVGITLLVPFMFLSRILETSGATDSLIDLSLALVGRVRGGSAKVAIVASSLVGMTTGFAVVNVATSGVVTIPLMKKTGYEPYFAGAVESVASLGSQITPPVMGAVAFVMADLLEIPYMRVCGYAIIPCLIYYAIAFLCVDLHGARLKLGSLPEEEIPGLKRALINSISILITLVVLIVILSLGFHAALAAYGAAVSLLVSCAITKGPGFAMRTLVSSLESGFKAVVSLGTITAAIGLITGSIALTGIGLRLTYILVQSAAGNLMLLLCYTAVICFILGMGAPTLVTYLVVATLMAPALVTSGIPEIAAHLFVFYWGMAAMITPPVALAAYTAAGLSGSDPFKTGWTAMGLGISLYALPFAFVYRPSLLGIGSVSDVGVSIVITLLALASLAIAREGYLLRQLNWLEKLLLVAAGITLIFFENAIAPIGVAIALGSFLLHYLRSKLILKPMI
ncbi:TRAP transporter permease [Thermodesulfobacteriota bacterium]